MEISADQFETRVLNSDILVLVEFWGSWCLPCQTAGDMLKEIKEECEGRIDVFKINMDKNPGVLDKFNITGLPTFSFFKEGKEVERLVGARSKKQLFKIAEKIV